MSLLDIHLTEMIGLTILHSLWQITLLWIVLVAVLRLCPKASSAVRYTFAVSILMLSVLTTAATAVYEWQLHATADEISVLSNGTTQAMHTAYITTKQTLFTGIVDALDASVPLLGWLWCAGLIVMGTRFGGSFFYLRTLRAQKNIAAISPFWEQELKRISGALGLRCQVAIATSVRVSSPLTLGSISPIILLPAGLLSGMSTTQVEAILVHELYHIKRRDYIINIGQALVEVLLFYHPAIWHINNIIREERENCCDDQTVAFCGDAIAYARALTQIQVINTLTKPTLAISATGPNAGNFTNRIKRLFNKYPNPAQARSKGIFAIGFLLAYLCIILISGYVSTAQPVEPAKKLMKPSISDNNTASNIFSDSIPVSNHLNVLESHETTPPHRRPVAGKKIGSMDIQQRADTTVRNQRLAGCEKFYAEMRKFRLLVETSSLFRFSKFSVGDSLQTKGSTDFLKIKSRFQPTLFHETFNPSKRAKLDLIGTTGNETTKDGIVDAGLKPGTAKEILIPGLGISQGSVRIFAGGMPLQEGTDYTVDYTFGKVIINNESTLSSGKHISVQYEQSDPLAFQMRSLVGTGVNYHSNEYVNAVQVFPNSTTGSLNISFTPARHNSRVEMILVDSNGKVVKEITDSTYDNIPKSLHVDVSGYKKGIYILQINMDGAKSQQRVVIE